MQEIGSGNVVITLGSGQVTILTLDWFLMKCQERCQLWNRIVNVHSLHGLLQLVMHPSASHYLVHLTVRTRKQ